jgi:hypothetical protein
MMVRKIDDYVAMLNETPAINRTAYANRIDWFFREIQRLILDPVAAQFPDPPPPEAQAKLAQAEVLRREAEALIAESVRLAPVSRVSRPTPPSGTAEVKR